MTKKKIIFAGLIAFLIIFVNVTSFAFSNRGLQKIYR